MYAHLPKDKVLAMYDPSTRKAVLSRRSILGGTIAAAAGVAPLLAACAPDEPAASAGTQNKTIEFWSQLAGSKKEAGDALCAAFQGKDGYQLNVNLLGDPAQMNQKLLTAFAGGTAPDLYIQGWNFSLNYASKGQLLDLTPYMEKHGLKAADIDPRAIAYGQIAGKTYSIPLYYTSKMIGINVKVATDAGLDVNNPPKNWEDMRRWAMAMTKRTGSRLEIAGWGLPDLGSNAFDNFLCAIQSAGGSLLSGDLKKVTLDNAQGIDGLSYLTKLMLEDKVCDPGFLNAGASNSDPFLTGHMGFTTTENWSINLAQKAGTEVKFIPFPSKTGGATSISNPFCFSIPKGSKNPDGAFEFIKFAMSLEQQAKFAATSRNLPALIAAQSDATLQKDKALADFIAGGAFAPKNPPAVPAYQQILTAVAGEIEKAMYGKSTPQEALQAAGKVARSALPE